MSGDRLGSLLRTPVMAAPMGGGPSVPSLVVAAAGAGAIGFLAAAYKTPQEVRAEIGAVRRETDEAFGVNLFVPGSPSHRGPELDAYVRSLVREGEAVGATIGDATWDDDGWAEKVALLLQEAPPIVTFTFGCPDADIVDSFRATGSVVGVTVTGAEEARIASGAGADFLVAQGFEAGGHRGTFANDDPAMTGPSLTTLLDLARSVSRLPVVAAGGIMDADGVEQVLARGAVAAQCGTAFLRCPESGAHPVHKDALASSRYSGTAVTRAFSGRPARGLVNRFMEEHDGAPAAYPDVNNATRPIRAAAARRGDADRLNLWAGTGFRQAMAIPAADVVGHLTPRRAPLRG